MKQQLLKLFAFVKKKFKFIRNHKKIFLPLIIVLVFLAIILRPKNATVIATQPAMRGDLIKSISITGSIESQNSVNLTFQSGGTVNYIGAYEGDSIFGMAPAIRASKLNPIDALRYE